ncbi:hypothetical protein PCANC_12760 [Puccinia coronata f. sp. avenae]|uniref:Uncharacterized protein n=1 Tax=Puccinia coronata f. sp. avenae TaxID=200324 RepID=A0A2N5VJP9_9BASI|nr:hypothetical protein PCASD_17006 [Puccinia coronata f. sp. avenae]PLW50225.1 hypothetical protein PCANC_12760 [Puccinia coronata f. sp. avenae]
MLASLPSSLPLHPTSTDVVGVASGNQVSSLLQIVTQISRADTPKERKRFFPRRYTDRPRARRSVQSFDPSHSHQHFSIDPSSPTLLKRATLILAQSLRAVHHQNNLASPPHPYATVQPSELACVYSNFCHQAKALFSNAIS